jgi:hypothetical protein
LYCAFGIAAALKSDAHILTRYGGESDTASYRVKNGSLGETPDIFHFSTPPRLWWKNVIYACSSFQPFRSHGEIDDWVARHCIAKGETMAVSQLWSFAQDWYGGYLNQPWRKRTPSEAVELFNRHGLSGEFWALS